MRSPAIFFLFAASTFGVVHPAGSAAAQDQTGRVRFQVYDEGTGLAVSGAWLQAAAEGERSGSVITDSAGMSTWDDLSPGSWNFRIRCPTGRRWIDTRTIYDATIEVRGGLDSLVRVPTPEEFCREPPVSRRVGVFSGRFTLGFESSTFMPDRPFADLSDTLYETVQMTAWVTLTKTGQENWQQLQGEWPEAGKFACYRVRWRGELAGPGSYGHMGIALYELEVEEVLESRLLSADMC